MYLIGDIGNSETKVFLVNNKNKVVKNMNFPSKRINNKILNVKFNYFSTESLFKKNIYKSVF